jgi:hypothetical protein
MLIKGGDMPDESGFSESCSKRHTNGGVHIANLQHKLWQEEFNKPVFGWRFVLFCIALVLIVSFALGVLIDPMDHWL